MAYDADGRSTSIVDPRGNVSGADPNLFRTAFTYDTDANRLTATDPLGNASVTTYDRVGNVASVKNPRGNTTTYTYDNANRVSKVTAPTVGATLYAYSTTGVLLSRTDPLARTATWAYDRANRVTKKTDPLGRFFTYGYDIAGNLTQIVDANANAATNPTLGTTTLAFDRLNRISTKTYSDGTAGVSWTYDTAGRRASMTDGTGTTTYGYDAGNRLATVTKGADTFTYVSDPGGNVTSRTYPDGRTVTATFNDAGETATVNDGNGAVTYAYDPAGNLNQMVLPAGVTQNRVYDRASRLTNINNQRAGGVFSQFTYTRDGNGNPTAIDVAGSGAATLDSQRNTFDTFDRLTKTCFTTTTCATANQTAWTYDKVGNRLTEKIGAAAVSTYTYDNSDQLTAIIGPGAASFTNNANGDQLAAGADLFGYNAARQPVSATVAGVTSAFTYDGNSNRTQITTAGVATAETVDINNPLPVIVTEKKAGVAVRTYSYAPGGTVLRYSDVAAATSGWYLADALGSTTEIVNPTGGTVATYRYNPFGTTRGTTLVGAGYTNNPLKYGGQQQDPTGTYNLRARHYNPTSGRFSQVDPAPLPAGSAFESSYVYGLNNPLRFIDPSGLRGQSTTCTTRVPIKSAAPQRLALTAPGGPQFDCESAWAKLLDGVFRVRPGALQGTKGLAVRFREMIQGGYDGAGRFPPGSPAARAEFEVHRVEYENQRVGGSGKRGLRKVLSDWKDNCPDDDPPSSVEVLQRLDVENWINASAPTWDQVSAAAHQVPASPSGQPGPNWLQRNIFNPINDASDAFWRELTKPRPAPRIPIPMPLPVPA
jgi:RHS repeat-associated protein